MTRVVLPDVGHVPWLEVPGEFASRLLDWLRRAPCFRVEPRRDFRSTRRRINRWLTRPGLTYRGARAQPGAG